MQNNIWLSAMVFSFFLISKPGLAQTKLKPTDYVPKDPISVINILDALTQKNNTPEIKVWMRSTFPQQKLQIGESNLDVHLEGRDQNWRGAVEVRMDLPTTVRYTVDLSKLEPTNLRWEPNQRRLVVKIPEPIVESVSGQMSKLQVKSSYSSFRYSWWDGGNASEVERRLLRENYEPAARAKAAEQLPSIRQQGRASLQDLLQKVMRGATADITVVVE